MSWLRGSERQAKQDLPLLSTPAPKAVEYGGGGMAGRMQAALATAVQTDADWKEF